MTDQDRQTLYTLMGQWGRTPDLQYQKVREWIEAREQAQPEAAALAKLLAEKIAAAESATARQILSKVEYDVWELDHDGHGCELTKLLADARREALEEAADDAYGTQREAKWFTDNIRKPWEIWNDAVCEAADTIRKRAAADAEKPAETGKESQQSDYNPFEPEETPDQQARRIDKMIRENVDRKLGQP